MRSHKVLQLIFLLCLVGSIGVYLFSRLRSRHSKSYHGVFTSPRTPPRMEDPGTPMRVLVTGGAGFIGFHLAKVLASQRIHQVVVMDNFNDYYDVRLKMDRAFELSKLKVSIYNDDVCNSDFLKEIFSRYKFTHVAHMAAQAGVRYSLENPLAYVTANIECQVALLEVLKEYPNIKLVYASSSSVYGKESDIPFTLTANTDQPGNMYAATKKIDELLGYHYCSAYNQSAVGLRFFTVYGPWGRPDMAVYKFADSMVEGKKVPLFHTDASKPLGRDFTYVDDVVSGISGALRYYPEECGERFNLGYGDPVSVPQMLDILQEQLKVDAQIDKLPLPPTEILQTWADISTSKEILNFHPVTPLEQGLSKFVLWYEGYRRQRHDEEKINKTTAAETFFNKLVSERDTREKRYDEKRIRDHNDKMNDRIYHERQKYLKWANENGVDVPTFKKNFEFIQGHDIQGSDIIIRPDLKDNVEGIKERCLRTHECTAFNTDGFMKNSIQKVQKQSKYTRPDQGIYIAKVDMCQEDLHNCAKHASCTPRANNKFDCHCLDGFVGSGHSCLPRLNGPRPRDLEWQYEAVNYNLYNITSMKQGKEMVYFENFSVGNDGDYMIADQHIGKPELLQQACIQDPICVAITTKGVMKRKILPSDRWVNIKAGGVYVQDVNYCLFYNEACPGDNICLRENPAQYRCSFSLPAVKYKQRADDDKHLNNKIKNRGGADMDVSEGGNVQKRETKNEEKEKLNEKVKESQNEMAQREDTPNKNEVAEHNKVSTQKTESNDKVVLNNEKETENDKVKQNNDNQVAQSNNEVAESKDEVAQKKVDNKVAQGNNEVAQNDPAKQNSKTDAQNDTKEKDAKQERLMELNDETQNKDLKFESQKPKIDANKNAPVGIMTSPGDGVVSSQGEGGDKDSGEIVNVVICVDPNDLSGIPTLLNSMIKWTKRPWVFHIVVVNMTSQQMHSFLGCSQFEGLTRDQVQIHEFPEEWLDDDYLEYIKAQNNNMKYLGSHANYARFFFHRLMPTVDKMLYIDADTVINNDIDILWSQISDQKLLTAIARHVKYSAHYGSKALDLYRQRFNESLKANRPSFNAGVFGLNLGMWRSMSAQIDGHLHYWLKQAALAKGNLWRFQTQPLMHLSLQWSLHEITTALTVGGLGYMKKSQITGLDTAIILHWNGEAKPWDGADDFTEYWNRYTPPVCNQHGICTWRTDVSAWNCLCNNGYSGLMCQNEA